MIPYPYFIIGSVDVAGLHAHLLQDSDISSLIDHVEIVPGTNSSGTAGYYIAAYFTSALSAEQTASLTSAIQSYTYP